MTLKTEGVHKNLDLNNEALLLNWGWQSLTSDPATTYARTYYNSVSGQLRLYDTVLGAWRDAGSSVTGDGSTIDITAGVVSVLDDGITMAKLAELADLRLIGNVSGGTANPAALTPAQVTTNFVVPDGSTLEISGGTVREKDGGTTNAKLANMGQGLIKGRQAAGGTGAPEDLTAAQVKTILALVAADISDFNTAVRTNRLDQMATPTASVSMGSQLITNLLAPVSGTDAANKAYVDAAAAGITWKQAVRVATTAAGTLATSFENGDTVDGVVLATGDRILIKDQASGAENGIYVVAASGAPARSSDADTSAEVKSGMGVFVSEGTANADTGWVLTTNDPITIGVTALVFAQFTALGQVTAGTGMTKTGSTLNVNAGATPGSGGPGGGLVANADDLVIDTAVVVRKFVADHGDGSTADIVVTHNLGTRDVAVTVYEKASPYKVHDVYWEATSTNTITVFWPSAPANAFYRVVVHA